MKNLTLLVCMLFLTGKSFAGNVRTVETNEALMKPIRLSLGQSTVLRFRDKPQKVIVGNQNYYNIEFVGNDLAIQPLANVDTNLFVYCDYGRVYGFLLNVISSRSYDDLVNVKWRPKNTIKISSKPKVKKRTEHLFNKILKITNTLQVKVEKVLKNEALGLYFIDMKISNLDKQEADLAKLKIFATRSNKMLSDQKIVKMKETLTPNEETQARMILKLKHQAGFSLNFEYGDKKNKTIIYRKYL